MTKHDPYATEHMNDIPAWVFMDAEEQEYDQPHDDLYLEWYESWDERDYADWLEDVHLHGSKLA